MDSGGSVRSRDERDERDDRDNRDDREEGDDHSETASTSKRQRTSLAGTGQGRGAGYSAAEVSFFLSLLEEHLPVTTREWKAVVRLHNAQFPSLKRSTNSLRRKFLALCRSASGKEEANWSPDVRRAYLARFRMKNRGDIPDEEVEADSDDDDDHEDDGRGSAVSAAQAQAQAAQAAMNQQRFYQQMPGQHEQQAMQPPPPQHAHPMYNPNNGGMRQPTISDRMMEAVEFRGAMPPHPSTVSEANLMELIKLQLLQNVEEDRRRRTEERERREAERRHWDEERAIRDDYRRRWEEERARREEDLRRWEEDRAESRRRHEEFMQLILSLVNKNK